MTGLTIKIDASGFQRSVGVLGRGLGLYGGASQSQLVEFVRNEAGHLALAIARAVGPADLPSARAKADRQIKGQLTAEDWMDPNVSFNEHSDLPAFKWLSAGPNFLTGIDDKDDLRGVDGEYVYKQFRSNQAAGPRGNKYVKLGKRGHQTIQRLNRLLSSVPVFNLVRRNLQNRFGILKASFSACANLLGVTGRMPGWVTKHYGKAGEDKSILHEEGLAEPGSPWLEFGSFAAGVVENQHIQEKIQGALKFREKILNDKFQKLMEGYVYNFNTGQIYKPKIGGEE